MKKSEPKQPSEFAVEAIRRLRNQFLDAIERGKNDEMEYPDKNTLVTFVQTDLWLQAYDARKAEEARPKGLMTLERKPRKS